MNKPYVSVVNAKHRTTNIYQEILKLLKEVCDRNHNSVFYHKISGVLADTPISWKKMGFNNAGRTVRRAFRGVNTTSIHYEIQMNINYLYSEDAEKFIRYTLIHELAHVIADVYNGSFSHNRTFKMFDRILGGTGERCCDYKTPINKPKSNKISFLCTHCGTKFMLTPYMLTKCKSGNYRCNCCHTNMKEIINFYGF